MAEYELTTAQLADKLQVHPETIYRWRSEGLPHKKLTTRSIRYNYQEVMDWLTSRNQK